ncbi:MAG: hypothetical protein OEN20_01460 [Gammaproteobacteria bacterium]|nr:hypothetical protein [Gammaproteobacteria bacterium]
MLATVTPVRAAELYFIDAHSQVDHEVEDLGLIIERMDAAGVSSTLLSSRGKRKAREILTLAKDRPRRIVAAVRTKSGAYLKNKPKYYSTLERQVGSGEFSAMAEVLLYHARKGDKAPARSGGVRGRPAGAGGLAGDAYFRALAIGRSQSRPSCPSMDAPGATMLRRVPLWSTWKVPFASVNPDCVAVSKRIP